MEAAGGHAPLLILPSPQSTDQVWSVEDAEKELPKDTETLS